MLLHSRRLLPDVNQSRQLNMTVTLGNSNATRVVAQGAINQLEAPDLIQNKLASNPHTRGIEDPYLLSGPAALLIHNPALHIQSLALTEFSTLVLNKESL